MGHDRENLDLELEAFTGHRTDLSRLTIDETTFFGTGGYIAVSPADLVDQTTQTKSKVAVKQLHPLAAIDLHLAFIRLIQVWSKLDYPNILSFIGFYHLTSQCRSVTSPGIALRPINQT